MVKKNWGSGPHKLGIKLKMGSMKFFCHFCKRGLADPHKIVIKFKIKPMNWGLFFLDFSYAYQKRLVVLFL